MARLHVDEEVRRDVRRTGLAAHIADADRRRPHHHEGKTAGRVLGPALAVMLDLGGDGAGALACAAVATPPVTAAATTTGVRNRVRLCLMDRVLNVISFETLKRPDCLVAAVG